MMLRMVCPRCHHRFPVSGCCLKWSDETGQTTIKEEEEKKQENEEVEEEKKQEEEEEEYEEEEEQEEEDLQEDEEEKEKHLEQENQITADTVCSTYYVSSLPMSHGYTSGNCFINPSINIQKPTIFEPHAINCSSNVGITNSDMELFYDVQTNMEQGYHSPICQSNDENSFIVVTDNLNYNIAPSEQYVATKCKLTGGSVTIATPDIQSGGCLIQNKETDFLVQASQIKIQPKHTGGGCLVQKKLSVEDERLMPSKHLKNFALANNNAHRTFVSPLNNSSELSGNIKVLSSVIRNDENNEISAGSRQQRVSMKKNDCCDCKSTFQQNRCQCHEQLFDVSLMSNRDSLMLEPIGNNVQFQVNATVQLPANLGQCTVNITATTATPPKQTIKLSDRGRNNFHGGGIVQPNELDCTMVNQIVTIGNSKDCNVEQRDDLPNTPVPWVMPTSWSLDSDINKLCEVKRLLQICGWYHEGISWQQSENFLKDASIGRWLMRDSSDSRYAFTVSVKTSRGPASIRVRYFLEKFRLDAAPKLALAMPFFDCPIKMLEYYVEYSKRMDEHRTEVWVDFNGQLYSHIYLTNPIVKEVRSLSHLARLAVNRSKLPIERLPLLIKNYIKEYPYML